MLRILAFQMNAKLADFSTGWFPATWSQEALLRQRVEPLAVTKVDAAAELARWLHAPAHLDAGEATAGHGRNGCGRAVPLACAVEAERGREEEGLKGSHGGVGGGEKNHFVSFASLFF